MDAHSGNFRQGDMGDTYTITVSNAGPGPTVGTVSVSDTLPAGLTAPNGPTAQCGGTLVIVMGLTQAGGRPYAAGVTLLTDIFKHWPWIPVLVFAHPGPGTGLRADVLLSGVRAVFPHPASGPTLKRAIRQILSRAPTRDPQNGAMAMKRVRAFLDDHDDSRYSLADLAQRAGLSRSYFSTRFHAVLGMSLRESRRTPRSSR